MSNLYPAPRHRPACRLTAAAAVVLLSGCILHLPKACDRPDVSAKVANRTGFTVGPPPGPVPIFPNGACLDDGLLEDEAVLIALWNNALFQEQLADLGIAHGDLVQAGLLPNPEFVYFWPAPEKPFKYLFDFALESLWLRPIRIKAAAGEAGRVCERLTQVALDLIRDVRVAYAEALLAKGRLRVAEEALRIRGQIARIAEARLKAGDISVQEATTARIDSLTAQQDAARIRYDVSLTEERLRNLLGLGPDRAPFTITAPPPPLRPDLDAEKLTAEAISSRPDALAAEQNATAAAERVRLAKLGWFRVLGILDATSGRGTGHEFSPALRVTLPIFNWNQGAIARAEAEYERADRQRLTVRNQIILDVHLAHFRYTQARVEMEILAKEVLPEAERAISRAERAYREGNTPYVVVLEAARQLLDSLLRKEILEAELRRAWAELERSVGYQLESPAPGEGGSCAAPATGAKKEEAPAPTRLPEPADLPPAGEPNPAEEAAEKPSTEKESTP